MLQTVSSTFRRSPQPRLPTFQRSKDLFNTYGYFGPVTIPDCATPNQVDGNDVAVLLPARMTNALLPREGQALP